jgi:hypothetical protein
MKRFAFLAFFMKNKKRKKDENRSCVLMLFFLWCADGRLDVNYIIIIINKKNVDDSLCVFLNEQKRTSNLEAFAVNNAWTRFVVFFL